MIIFWCFVATLLLWHYGFSQDKKVMQDLYKIPYKKIKDKELAEKVKRVVGEHDIEVVLEQERVESSVGIYDFLLEELPFTASVVRLLGKGKYEIFTEEEVCKDIKRKNYYMDDGEKLLIKANLVYKDKSRWVYYTTGCYDAGILGEIWGESVIIVVCREKGKVLLTEAKIFAYFDSGSRIFAGVLKKFAKGVIEKKAGIFVVAARTVSEFASKDPKEFCRQLEDCKNIDKEVLERFKRRFVENGD